MIDLLFEGKKVTRIRKTRSWKRVPNLRDSKKETATIQKTKGRIQEQLGARSGFPDR